MKFPIFLKRISVPERFFEYRRAVKSGKEFVTDYFVHIIKKNEVNMLFLNYPTQQALTVKKYKSQTKKKNIFVLFLYFEIVCKLITVYLPLT